ncbi:hypothetical protein [Pseudonocardia acidicola]|uniref:M3 family oligoendopeptidase n=1 Tax=Pseudonocardia acidicola TaxID=2724939 RepID=A0ABX1SGP4_9PSEU|nr:hypothetical protein [Pseudonocardia acidicola]NMI00732.1 M3 family oligoendopeptidase [Pseudonocardia acidicola]
MVLRRRRPEPAAGGEMMPLFCVLEHRVSTYPRAPRFDPDRAVRERAAFLVEARREWFAAHDELDWRARCAAEAESLAAHGAALDEDGHDVAVAAFRAWLLDGRGPFL